MPKNNTLTVLLRAHTQQTRPSPANMEEDLTLALYALAEKVAAERRWCHYSLISEWQDHAFDRLLVAAGKYDPQRCSDPLAYLTRTARNAIIEKMRVALGTNRKAGNPTPELAQQHSGARLDATRKGDLALPPNIENYVQVANLRPAGLTDTIPPGKRGLYRHQGVVWVITRMEDTDL